MFRSIARDKNNSFPENLCQIIAFKLLENVTKNQFVQSSVALVINSQSQNEYKCTQDVFRVLNGNFALISKKAHKKTSEIMRLFAEYLWNIF